MNGLQVIDKGWVEYLWHRTEKKRIKKGNKQGIKMDKKDEEEGW